VSGANGRCDGDEGTYRTANAGNITRDAYLVRSPHDLSFARPYAGSAMEGSAVTVLQVVGATLVVIGVVEFLVFRYLAPRQERIAQRMTLLNANSAFNVVAGIVLVLVGR
jgi:hypothetical protein